MNVTVHAAETTVERLTEEHLPMLLQAAGAVSADFAQLTGLPVASSGAVS
jgi:IclR family pca regulon transcriptional regulator